MRGGDTFGMASALAAKAAGSVRRIYGAENIRRYLQQQKREYGNSPGSLAPYDHEHKRANARRVRQAERDRRNQQLRWFGVHGLDAPTGEIVEVPGRLSRRGRPVSL